MSRTLSVALGLGAVSIFGAAVYLLISPRAAVEDAPAKANDPVVVRGEEARAAHGGGHARPKDLSGRVAQLEGEMDALRKEVALMRRASGVLKRPIAADNGDIDLEDPVFEGSVREIIEADKEEARESERERRKERFASISESALERLRDDSGVTEEQSEQLATLWQTEVDKLMPLVDQARSGERPFNEVREELRTTRDKSDAAAKELLTDEQYEAYLELRPMARGGGRGGRGDAGRGGRGG